MSGFWSLLGRFSRGGFAVWIQGGRVPGGRKVTIKMQLTIAMEEVQKEIASGKGVAKRTTRQVKEIHG